MKQGLYFGFKYPILVAECHNHSCFSLRNLRAYQQLLILQFESLL